MGLVGLILVLKSFFTVEQQSAAVIQRFGKFLRIANAGLNFKIPIVDQVAFRSSLRIQPLELKVETKTRDNVFVIVMVSVQYYVLPDKVKDAYYRLQEPAKQIASYVFDVVRAQVPKLTLDEVFEKKDDVANAVRAQLSTIMDDYGYGISNALVTDVEPDGKVKESMNAINAAQRNRVAAQEQGEADKILMVKKAEAEADSKKLQGEGIANQRKAIIDGLRESIEHFSAGVEGVEPTEVMQLVLLNQYFDMIKEVGQHGTNTIFLPYSPGGMADLGEQLRNAVIAGNAANGNGHGPDLSIKPRSASKESAIHKPA